MNKTLLNLFIMIFSFALILAGCSISTLSDEKSSGSTNSSAADSTYDDPLSDSLNIGINDFSEEESASQSINYCMIYKEEISFVIKVISLSTNETAALINWDSKNHTTSYNINIPLKKFDNYKIVIIQTIKENGIERTSEETITAPVQKYLFTNLKIFPGKHFRCHIKHHHHDHHNCHHSSSSACTTTSSCSTSSSQASSMPSSCSSSVITSSSSVKSSSLSSSSSSISSSITSTIEMIDVTGTGNVPVTLTFRNVTLSSYKIAKYEITYEVWYNIKTWALANGYTFGHPGMEGGDLQNIIDNTTGNTGAPTSKKKEPVTSIDWRDAVVWCNAISQKDGLTPVYYADANFTTPIKSSTISYTATAKGSVNNPYVNWNANGYRLPTSAEWEYAARGGQPAISNGSWSYNYSGSNTWQDVAWFYSSSYKQKSYDVGLKLPNALGTYDMSGNVREWCWDMFETFNSDPVVDPRGPEFESVMETFRYVRLCRGGGWNTGDSNETNVAATLNENFYVAFDTIGFRVARSR